MESVTKVVLLKALDGLAARAAASAQNIANAGSQGYRPLKVEFEQALASAAPLGPGAIARVVPKTIAAKSAEPLRLDLELADASATAGKYGAFIELLGRQLQLEALSINGTK